MLDQDRQDLQFEQTEPFIKNVAIKNLVPNVLYYSPEFGRFVKIGPEVLLTEFQDIVTRPDESKLDITRGYFVYRGENLFKQFREKDFFTDFERILVPDAVIRLFYGEIKVSDLEVNGKQLLYRADTVKVNPADPTNFVETVYQKFGHRDRFVDIQPILEPEEVENAEKVEPKTRFRIRSEIVKNLKIENSKLILTFENGDQENFSIRIS